MGRYRAIIAVLLLGILCSCGPRVIPQKKFARILEDMFLSDIWLKQNSEFTGQADTSLFYDAVLAKYGYTFEDFDTTVKYYCEHTEEYVKVIEKAKEIVAREQAALRKELDEKSDTLEVKDLDFLEKKIEKETIEIL